MPFSKGDPNINRKGRIDGGGGLKDYDRKKFQEMSDIAKDEFLKTLTPELRYRMAEGNPATNTDLKFAGELKIVVSKETAERYGLSVTQDTEDNSEGQTQV